MTTLSDDDTRLTLAESTIPGAGLGVFAVCPLAVGDRIRVVGVLIDARSPADRCTAYADAYKIRVGDRLLIPVGFAGMVNHSETSPNLEKAHDDGEFYFRVVRPIAVGAELLFRYSAYARERFGL